VIYQDVVPAEAGARADGVEPIRGCHEGERSWSGGAMVEYAGVTRAAHSPSQTALACHTDALHPGSTMEKFEQSIGGGVPLAPVPRRSPARELASRKLLILWWRR
jgi:hypothetical protein